jgi:membrane-bound ClpP family serine protease
MEVSMRAGGILGAVAVVWLLIGVFAAYQRHYFENGPTNCAEASTVAMTVIAGPLNYKFNPAVNCPNVNVNVPQPK